MIDDQIAAALALEVRNAAIVEGVLLVVSGGKLAVSGGSSQTRSGGNQTTENMIDASRPDNLGAIIGGAVGGAVLLAGVITLGVCCTMKRDKDRKAKK